MSRSAELDLGLVVTGHGRHYTVETPEGTRLHCTPRGKKSECVVGDRVRWMPTSSGEGVIEAVEPRRNLMHRQDEWKTKSFAANLDQLLVLVAAEPVFSESQLARALIAAEAAGIPAAIVLNKADLPAIAAPAGCSGSARRGRLVRDADQSSVPISPSRIASRTSAARSATPSCAISRLR